MNCYEFLLYCRDCGGLSSWPADDFAIECDCGESGGLVQRFGSMYNFSLWGECVPIKLDSLDDQARRAIAGETPLLDSVFRITGWIPTKKNKEIDIVWYDDEEEFLLATEQ